MQGHTFARVVADPQRPDWLLERELQFEAPDLLAKVTEQCREARQAGHPEVARELLESAIHIVRTIKEIDHSQTPTDH